MELKDKPTLNDIQEYVSVIEKEKGYIDNKMEKETSLLIEEVGEFFKALRKKTIIKPDHDPKFRSVDEELADIIFHLCAIANRMNIDLEKAFRNKDRINKKRDLNK